MSNHKLIPLIKEEGYCCLYGFLTIEKLRGQTPESLAAYWGFDPSGYRYHYSRLQDEKRSHRCCGAPDCLKPEIQLIAGLLP